MYNTVMEQSDHDKEKMQYLEEDQDLLKELDSIGPLSTGLALEEQKKKIETIQIKALLRSRKAAKDTEVSTSRYSDILMVFAVIQVVVAWLQLVFSAGTATQTKDKLLGGFVILAGGGFMWWLYRFISKRIK